ncbi:MAG: MoaD family protein [Limnochordaceae bacterium]|uniref:MoaD family protein n=1 Tax=Carboxydichorda subterranea TaxID=3109565 RepID=A0ABZ1BZX9_9FIRM|nr:MoaD family protein [Limnochorda sp. L945t]MBE3598330.1 MoaD family protein [Limnochordaceae bacterium]WRP18140.1 MoaD family protein [Limnochorda sp. L945t]
MAVTVRVPQLLRGLTNGEKEVQVEASTVAEAIQALELRYPGIRQRLVDGGGDLHRYVNLFVNDQDVRLLSGLDTPLPEGSEIAIVPAMAGGC